jgi:tetratricopeptide (TPR) repeat protein
MSRAEKQLRRKRRKERRGRDNRRGFFDLDFHSPRRSGITFSYDITTEPLPLPEEPDSFLDQSTADLRANLHNDVFENPKSVIPQLEPLLARHPDSRILMNWLSAAYSRVGRDDDANQILKRNYFAHPNYLFARLNYAQMLMREDRIDDAAEVMEYKWDLKALYPHRDVFHLTEFLAFGNVAVEYFTRSGDPESAENIYEVMKDMAPDHEVTLMAEDLLGRFTLLRGLERVIKLFGGGKRKSALSPRKAARILAINEFESRKT